MARDQKFIAALREIASRDDATNNVSLRRSVVARDQKFIAALREIASRFERLLFETQKRQKNQKRQKCGANRSVVFGQDYRMIDVVCTSRLFCFYRSQFRVKLEYPTN